MEAVCKCYTIDLQPLTKDLRSLANKLQISSKGNYALAMVAVTDLNTGLANLDAAGYKILGILQQVGFWIVTIKCSYDLIQLALKGDRKSIGGVIITYVIIYGSLFFVPWMLKLVANIF